MGELSSVTINTSPKDVINNSSLLKNCKDSCVVNLTSLSSPPIDSKMPEPVIQKHSYLNDMKDILLAIILTLRAIICLFIPSCLYSRERDVTGLNIVITGGAFGLGRLMSRKLAARGAKVIILDINHQHMQETVDMINDSSDQTESLTGKAYSYFCDVSDRNNVYSVSKQVESEIGPVDILIMNAGVVNGGSLLKLKDESIIRLFNINTFAHFWLMKAFLPSMMSRNSGHVVSIDSVASYWGTAELADYCASKAASHKLQESVDFELRYAGYDGIKITSIMPYFMNTGMFAGSYSKYFNILEPEIVADASVRAVLTGQSVVFVPCTFHVLRALTYIVPYSACFYVHRALFGGKMMSNFTGRGATSPTSPTKDKSTDPQSTDINFTYLPSDKENNYINNQLISSH